VSTIPGREEDIDELPPLDGDADDPPGEQPEHEPDLHEDESAADLDDSTGEDAQPEALELDPVEGAPWLNESSDNPDLDIGADLGLDLPDGDVTSEGDESAAGAEELGLGEGLEVVGLDSGEEGPQSPDEELRDRDLPDLGGPEEDEVDEGARDRDTEGFAADEPMGLKWAAAPWPRVGSPAPLTSARAVACIARGALAFGRVESGSGELSRVDLEGGCQSVPARGLAGLEVKALRAEGDRLAAVVEGGGVFVSQDAGLTFQPLNPSIVASEVAWASGTLWMRTVAGGLVRMRDGGAPEPLDVGAPLAGIASDGTGGFAALLMDGTRRPVGVLRVHQGGIDRQALDGREPCGPLGLFAARGRHIAYAARRGVVTRGPDGEWRRTPWEGTVVSVSFLGSEGALLAASYSEVDDIAGLVRLDPGLAPCVVALVGAAHADADSDGRVEALACDEPRGVVWAAGGFGLVAFGIR
jgi:hypothetical protein